MVSLHIQHSMMQGCLEMTINIQGSWFIGQCLPSGHEKHAHFVFSGFLVYSWDTLLSFTPILHIEGHSNLTIPYIGIFGMANANIRHHLTEAEMWRSVVMVEQVATHHQVDVAFDVDQTVIAARVWSKYQQHSTTVRRHVGGRHIARSIIQALRGRF